MQFKVPQDVQREDRIVGPLTLKQLIICGIGGMISYAIYVSLAKTYIWLTWLPPVTFVVLVTLAFAFVRPLDLSFARWILLWIEFSLIPKKRVWIKSSAEFYPPQTSAKTKNAAEKAVEKKLNSMEEKQKKLEELTAFLESQKKH